MNYNNIIESIFSKIHKVEEEGKLADYIPELALVDPNKFGIHLSSINKEDFGIGDYQERFSIQSIAKVFSLMLAYKLLGETIWNRLGVEPSGTKFNSFLQLEYDNGIPRNPFINAGAIVISDILVSELKNPKDELLRFIQNMNENSKINYSPKIAASEKSIGHLNIALCNLMKSYGNIKNDPEEVLDFYFDLCSLESTCEDLSNSFLFLANHGRTIQNNTEILTKSQSKRINAIMQTCGFYDESGEFTYKVGLPGKSGVGGGIIAIHPGQYSVVVWSPLLNKKGNSIKGIKFLEEFTTITEQSIF
jgi:glutaminase